MKVLTLKLWLNERQVVDRFRAILSAAIPRQNEFETR